MSRNPPPTPLPKGVGMPSGDEADELAVDE